MEDDVGMRIPNTATTSFKARHIMSYYSMAKGKDENSNIMVLP